LFLNPAHIKGYITGGSIRFVIFFQSFYIPHDIVSTYFPAWLFCSCMQHPCYGVRGAYVPTAEIWGAEWGQVSQLYAYMGNCTELGSRKAGKILS
jgi:hypothetical protein